MGTLLGTVNLRFYRAIDARSASAPRGIAIASRPSVRLSVCDVDLPWVYTL